MNDRSRLHTYKEMVDTDVARNRIEELLEIAAAFYPERIEDVFVSEYREKEGRQVIDSVWMFTETYIMEFKDPLQEENFDLVALKNSVTYLQASRKEFDFGKWTDESRFSLHFHLASGVYGNLTATQRNCPELLRIAKERMFPNLAPPGTTAISHE